MTVFNQIPTTGSTVFEPIRTLVVISILVAATLVGQTQALVSSFDFEQSMVVKIRVERPGGSGEAATGFYVGKDQTFAYFATVFHALKMSNTRTVKVVAVNTKESPQDIRGNVLDHVDPELDLAVITIPTQLFSQKSARIVVADPALGSGVRIIGNPAGSDWALWTGTIRSLDAGGDPRMFTTNAQSLSRGYSGGPVFDRQGFLVGMHKDGTNTYGRAVNSAEILRMLRIWRVPTNGLKKVDLEGGGDSPEDPDKQACMNGSIVSCQNYANQVLVGCNQFGAACKVRANCWADKVRALQVVENSCSKSNDQNCEFMKENLRHITDMDCDKEPIKNFP